MKIHGIVSESGGEPSGRVSSEEKAVGVKLHLSVVLIARNEEDTIGQCIESVLENVKDIQSEVILVDSASTDKTIEIASRYPITILQLAPEMKLSPSAGRFVGANHAVGSFILFLDADMVLIKGWLDEALKAMNDSSVAAVAGRTFGVAAGEKFNFERPNAYTMEVGEVLCLGGAGLYRTDALVAAGGWNPFVKGEEERELGHRIVALNYVIKRSETPMVYHIDKGKCAEETNEKASYFQGAGQIFRAYRGRPIAKEIIKVHRFTLRSCLVLLITTIVVPLLLIMIGSKSLFFLFIGVSAAGLMWLWYKGVAWKIPLYFRARFLLLFNFVLGWLKGIPHPATYKVAVSILQKGTK